DEVQLGERGEMVPGDVAGADDGDPQPAGVGRNEGSGQLVHVVAGCGRWKCSSRVETTLSTRRSQVWSETAATRSSAASRPVSSRDASIAARKDAGSSAMRTQRENFSISGLRTLTTGRPAARYSRSLSGFALAIQRLRRCGIRATSIALDQRPRVA